MKGIRLVTTRDWTGGLNFNKNPMELKPNESPDLMNVDIAARGGFRLRKGLQPFSTGTTGPISSIHWMSTVTGTQTIIAGNASTLQAYTAGGVASALTGGTRAGPHTSTEFKEKLYLANGSAVNVKYDPSTPTVLTSLGTAFNNNRLAPTGGNMPQGKLLATYRGCVIVANTIESTVAWPNRIRWSHLNQPEDYYDTDFIDVDTGHDGDQITALVPFQDKLLIFKEHAVYALFGTPPDGFSVYPISSEVGTMSQRSVVATDHGVYFFDWPNGIFLWNGKSLSYEFQALQDCLLDGRINSSARDIIQVGFGNRRLWVSVPWNPSTTRNRCFVMDTTLKDGAWVQYDIAAGPFLVFDPPGTTAPQFLAGAANRIIKLDQNITTDTYDSTVANITSWYTTPWFDMGEHVVKKRWKRPELLLIDNSSTRIFVEVYIDYDFDTIRKTLTFDTTSSPTGAQWNVSQWDNSQWGGNVNNTESYKVVRGSPLGNGRSVALRIRGPVDNHDWGVNALTLKVIPKPVRS